MFSAAQWGGMIVEVATLDISLLAEASLKVTHLYCIIIINFKFRRMYNRINVSEKNVKTQGHKNKNAAQKRFHHFVKSFTLTKNCGFSSFLLYCCGNQRNFSSKITFYPCLLLRIFSISKVYSSYKAQP